LEFPPRRELCNSLQADETADPFYWQAFSKKSPTGGNGRARHCFEASLSATISIVSNQLDRP
jgi:hypothetical protein